ncbi:putative phosphinothricin acetyltransferase YwnH [Streptomyces sp. YIM 130001]|uniref:GNAT family N-acetyltransferase n=1 Tax=Streptomyces sp. YIM 130001 TaxID=2259644 RepID=UPI000E64AE06|nr:GNAT family N-acetyltransferase [Streptomyces sp. YIM 130001]RII17126.1 putative phosphinothricin acetyltransferase YwnH [Streptomyces sp. YIM 130001]
MSEAFIRSARWSDADALGRLDRATWSTVHAVQPKPAPSAPFFDATHDPGQFLVAEAHGDVVGYIRLCRSLPVRANAHVLQIQGFAVAEAARGRGTGRALVRAACAAARDRGARRLTLRVLGHNVAARALYASEGFAVEGVLPGEFLLDGKYVDDVLMGRAI